MTVHRTIEIDGLDVFFREGGQSSAPAIVLLHGYPSSSHMFRDLIPLLAERLHVVAPDLIGFGHSEAPPADRFNCTFDNLSRIVGKLLASLELQSYVLYLHGSGGAVGLRLAMAQPERVRGLVVQNANAYIEGISDRFASLFFPLWKRPSPQTFAAARTFMTAEAIRLQYTAGAHDPAALNPDAWTLDQALLERPGVADAQLALFLDYRNNIAAYDEWHAWLRQHQPKTLILWGKNDPLFLLAGAEAFKRDLPSAELIHLDGGHFALEEHAPYVAAEILRAFAPRTGVGRVEQFYSEIASGRLDAASALLSEDVSWNDPKGFPYGGQLTGLVEVRNRVFEHIAAEWTPFRVEVDRVAQLADTCFVLAVGRYTGTHQKSGRALEVRFAHLWKTTGGELTRFEAFTDTATLRSAMGV